jgi:aryl-alcohol dehydrogenase-like predicted oxidoreductase
MTTNELPTRFFGREGQAVTIVGLGGEGILRTYGQEENAQSVILEALEQGIAYFDSARVYAGSEGYYGSLWPRRPEMRSKIFQTSKSASRDKSGALADLDQTLSTMGISHLDLWQIHDVRTEEDLGRIGGPKGALEAFVEAKKAGKVRFIGVTGHHDPNILSQALRDWPVDSVMMPVNPVEGAIRGFLDSTLPLAKEKGMAVIGMKVLGASQYILPELGITPELLIRYALSQDITVAIVGCSSPREVLTLAKAGRDYKPFSKEEQESVVNRFRPYAKGLAYYRGVI